MDTLRFLPVALQLCLCSHTAVKYKTITTKSTLTTLSIHQDHLARLPSRHLAKITSIDHVNLQIPSIFTIGFHRDNRSHIPPQEGRNNWRRRTLTHTVARNITARQVERGRPKRGINRARPAQDRIRRLESGENLANAATICVNGVMRLPSSPRRRRRKRQIQIATMPHQIQCLSLLQTRVILK